jgi:hypothetical protein
MWSWAILYSVECIIAVQYIGQEIAAQYIGQEISAQYIGQEIFFTGLRLSPLDISKLHYSVPYIEVNT